MNACDASCAALLEVVGLAGSGARHDQRPGLGADDVIGGDDAGAGITGELVAVDKVEDRRRWSGNRGSAAAARLRRRSRAARRRRAASARRRRSARSRLATSRRRTRLAALAQPLLRERHAFDHALVSSRALGAEGEDAVLVEHQAFDLRILSKAARRAAPVRSRAVNRERSRAGRRTLRRTVRRSAGRSGSAPRWHGCGR